MNENYFVLITDENFGVFRIDAKIYPTEYLENMNCVKLVKSSDVNEYLLKNLGRNILISLNYSVINCVGKLYPRHID